MNMDVSSPSINAAVGSAALSMQFLTFLVGDEEYGIEITQVRELKGWTPTAALPNMPSYMRGVLNLRGVIIPVFDLRARFGKTLTDATEKHVVIIVALESRLVGLLIDSVSDILTAQQADIKPVPAMSLVVEKQYLRGLIPLDDRMVVLLDMERLIDGALVEQAAAQH